MKNVSVVPLLVVAIALLLVMLSSDRPEADAGETDAAETVEAELSQPVLSGDSDCATSGLESQSSELEIAGLSASCGGTICGKGTYCCNASCGRCVPFGMSCTQESCN